MTTISKDEPIKRNKNDNLKPFKKGQRTSEEQVELARKGGIASGKARKEQKLLKDELLRLSKESDWNEMLTNLIDRAKNNDKSFEVFRDTIGQKPKEQIEASINDVVIKVGFDD